MNERTRHDLLRAWIRGELTAQERALLERELAANPAARAQADELRAVWSATAGLEAYARDAASEQRVQNAGSSAARTSDARAAQRVDADARVDAEASVDAETRFDAQAHEHAGLRVPVSSTSWEMLARRAQADAPPRRLRRVAAAAAIVLALGALAFGAWRAFSTGANAPIVVRRTLLEAPASLPEAPPPVPPSLADFRPVKDGPDGTRSMQWLDTLADARALSQAVGRPLLVFGFVPGCPWCKTLREETFTDPAFLALASETVPVAIDLLALDPTQAETLFERGYPLIELQDARGTILHTMSGPPGTFDVRKELASGLKSAPKEHATAPIGWDAAAELARELATARDAESDGRLAQAWREYEDVARRGGELAFGRAATLGLARLEEFGRSALLAARASTPQHAIDARNELVRVAQRLADTPPGDDLRRIVDAWRAGEPLPPLVPASAGTGE